MRRVSMGTGPGWVVAFSGSAAQPTLSLFRHAARLSVNGEAFVAESAAASPEFRVRGDAGRVVVRDIWIDRDRGAIRFCDTVANPGAPAPTLVHQTQFDQPVPALHRTDGAAVAEDTTEIREGVVAFLRNPTGGHVVRRHGRRRFHGTVAPPMEREKE